MISIMVSHFDYEHRCLIEKNVSIALILPSRWQDGAETLGFILSNCSMTRFGKISPLWQNFKKLLVIFEGFV